MNDEDVIRQWLAGSRYGGDELPEVTVAVRRLLADRDRLAGAIAEHHRQKADDRCIEDDDRLYAAAGLPPCDRRVGDKFQMHANCWRFINQRCEGGGWPSYAELEADRDRLAARVETLVADWSEDHTHLQDLCRKAGIAEAKIVGDTDGIPGVGDLGDMLAGELAEVKAKHRFAVQEYVSLQERRDDLCSDLAAARAEAGHLARFKAWVHNYLDTHGVPFHPPGTHGAEGCRIGDRMDWLMVRLAAAEAGRDRGMEDGERAGRKWAENIVREFAGRHPMAVIVTRAIVERIKAGPVAPRTGQPGEGD